MKKFIFVVCFIILSGCKGDNAISKGEMQSYDFSVQCLYGFNYIIRLSGGKLYMAPKFDKETAMPERCEAK